MEEIFEVTRSDLKKVFSEWFREYQETPEDFTIEFDNVAEEEYSYRCSEYLINKIKSL